MFEKKAMALPRLALVLVVAFVLQGPLLVVALYRNGSVVAPCDSPIYCYGEMLEAIELARPFADSKTFVDLPAKKSLREIQSAFAALPKPIRNDSALHDFLAANFGDAGSELVPVPRAKLATDPVFLPRVADPLYYLNRSQPPMLAQMVHLYLRHTSDVSVLQRALPLLEREHLFWADERSVEVMGPDGRNWTLSRYAVDNNQPRPESFREDYEMAHGNGSNGSVAALDTAQRERLYANLATAAESGWDFSSRWLARPLEAARAAASSPSSPTALRSLNGNNIVPVCLNSILYANERAMADFYRRTHNSSAAETWDRRASSRADAMHAVLWNENLHSYFDYNLTARAHNAFVPLNDDDDDDSLEADRVGAPPGHQVFFHAAQLFPFWMGAAHEELRQRPEAVLAAYARVAGYLDVRSGGIPATNFRSGQQWDRPNVWPPLMHVLMQGLLASAGGHVDAGGDGGGDGEWAGVRRLAQRLAQRYVDITYCTWRATGGTWSSSLSASSSKSLPVSSASTSPTSVSSISSVSPASSAAAAVSSAATSGSSGASSARGKAGVMFEKYADNATSATGSGGEYTVVEGFGWSNGVLIWVADIFGSALISPICQ